MAGSLNMVQLIGNLGRDPEIRTTQSGGKVCTLSIATSESWKDKASGERKEKTEWHRVVIWDENLVSVAERFLKKGSTVYLQGALETRKWTDQGGVERYSTEVMLKKFISTLTMLGGKSDGGSYQESHHQQPTTQTHQPAAQSGGQLPNPSSAGQSDFDDDIPF